MPRILPAALDIILVSTLLAGLRRSGNFEFVLEHIQSAAVRWFLMQFLFLGERFLDLLLMLTRKYPAYFRPRLPLDAPRSLPTPNAQDADTPPSVATTPQSPALVAAPPTAPAAQPYDLIAAQPYHHSEYPQTGYISLTSEAAMVAHRRGVETWAAGSYHGVKSADNRPPGRHERHIPVTTLVPLGQYLPNSSR
ncbi:hypothetical protein DFS34DRAFT_653897 [Phlyctochytrium arcticum]|nr:hypothetical protein DFS34DRAFT_653897 [Phlyctochytrium arcticum]